MAHEDVSAGLGYVLSDGARILDVNEGACRITGYTRDELLALPSAFALLAPNMRERLQGELVEKMQSATGAWVAQAEIVRKDGRPVAVEVGACLIGNDGHPKDVLAVFHALDEWSVSHRRLADALYATAGPTWLFEPHTNDGSRFQLIASNEVAAQLPLFEAPEGADPTATHNGTPRIIEERLAKARSSHEIVQFYHAFPPRNSELASVLELTAVPLSDERVLLRGTGIEDAIRAAGRRRNQMLARPLVLTAVKGILKAAGMTPERLRGVGASLAALAQPGEIDDALRVYEQMGLGRLVLAEHRDNRFVFVGHVLAEQSAGKRMTTCDLTLGFLTSVVQGRLEHPTFGAEVACVSKGDPECRFEIRSR